MPPLKGLLLLVLLAIGCHGSPLEDAIDDTLQLASGAMQPSQNGNCLSSMQTLLLRSNISSDLHHLRTNASNTELMRIVLLASIALISPWDQDASTGRFLITERGVLVEAYHPSTSESDIMLCVVCSLLAIIVMFHITEAQRVLGGLPEPILLNKGS